jgi:hypothetical protein
MKITEPYSPSARAKASEKAGQHRRREFRQHDAAQGGEAARAERGRPLPRFAAERFEHRLQRAHGEGQADEHQRDHDAAASRRRSSNHAVRRSARPQPFDE